MDFKREIRPLAVIAGIFLIFFYLPLGSTRFDNAVMEAIGLTQWYAREHVILCLLPAFFIAGAIAVFISQASVMKYLGAKANKVLSYGVASVSGAILAVCSCTVLPLFAGIYRMGAGLGPATAFLYAGPAINVLAIILTARVLGVELGIARAVGAVLFSIVIGLIMNFIYRKEENDKIAAQQALPEPEVSRPLWQNVVYFGAMIAILVFANWGKPEETTGLWFTVYSYKWIITSVASAIFGVLLIVWFRIVWWKVASVAVITGNSGRTLSPRAAHPIRISSSRPGRNHRHEQRGDARLAERDMEFCQTNYAAVILRRTGCRTSVGTARPRRTDTLTLGK